MARQLSYGSMGREIYSNIAHAKTSELDSDSNSDFLTTFKALHQEKVTRRCSAT